MSQSPQTYKVPDKFKRELWPVGVFALSLVCCVCGIAYAIFIGTADDGGRGGAVGVALSFIVLFAGRNVPKEILETDFGNDLDKILGDKSGKTLSGDELIQKVKVVAMKNRTALNSMIDWAEKEKRWLTASSAISTLAWGFGDSIAKMLGAA